MREINFLPTWYPKVVRQKRLLTAQAWGTAIVVVGGLTGLLITHRVSMAAAQELMQSQDRAQQVLKRVHQLDELLDLQRQLTNKQAIVGELGLPVEMNRVVAEMSACAPREVTFTQISSVTTERTVSNIAERAVASISGRSNPVYRQLELRLHGIAPTEGEVTAFWSRLMAQPSFSAVRLVNSNEKVDADHKMREFEITFNINLDPQGAS